MGANKSMPQSWSRPRLAQVHAVVQRAYKDGGGEFVASQTFVSGIPECPGASQGLILGILELLP